MMGPGFSTPPTVYPVSSEARDQFVLARRPPRPAHNPWQYQGLMVEDERAHDGRIARVATVFLTGRECPWRCVMCDLWQYTTTGDTPAGAIAAQVQAARQRLEPEAPPVTHVKLYNAGSFFDPRAVPEADYVGVAAALERFERVIVESHPALVGDRVDRFLEALSGPQLEVAMGLETAHPTALERLHKRMSVDQFAAAAEALRRRGAALRVFLLIAPPFIEAAEQDAWLLRSVDTASDCGAAAIALIPTRTGNGSLEALAGERQFAPPRLPDIERSFEIALSRRFQGRVFVDVWDLAPFASCTACLAARRARLHAMNLEQRILPSLTCAVCGHGL